MSNFAQTSPIQYKDYVAQNPVELMATVGMQREQQLQAGIEKVNSIASQVSSIDLYRDSDKEHLQSKLSELKTGITNNLSGDFSDQRVVGQIAGAASQIYKDEQIKNGIVSTMQVRKGITEMETARKEGKNGPSNDSAFNTRLSSYAKSLDPKASFNYNYEQYTPVEENMRKIITGMLPSGTTTDEAFMTDPKTGKQVLADYVLKNGFKGVKPDQIKAALRIGLSPKDWRQLELDGVYNYSNVPADQFSDNVYKRYQETIKPYQDKIDLIDGAITNSSPIKAQLQSTKESLQREITRLKGEYGGITSTFASGDTDSAKAKLYTMDKIEGTASSLAHGDISKTITGDTPQQMAKWREEKNMTNQHWNMDRQDKWAFHKDEMNEKRLTREQKDKENAATTNPTSGGILIPKAQEDLTRIQAEKILADSNKGLLELKDMESGYIFQQKLTNPSFSQANYDNLKNASINNPSLLNAEQKEYFNRVNAAETSLNTKIDGVNAVIKAVDKVTPTIQSLIPKDAKTLILTDHVNGNTYRENYTPTDFVQLNNLVNNYRTVTSTGTSSAGVVGKSIIQYNLVKAKAELPTNQYNILVAMAKNNSSDKNQQGALSSNEQLLSNYSRNYDNAVNGPHQAILRKRDDAITAGIQQAFFVKENSNNGLNLVSTEQKGKANNLLANLAQYAASFTKSKIGNATSEDLLAASRESEKTITFTTAEASEFQPAVNIMHLSSAKGTFDIPLSTEQMQGMHGNDFRAPQAVRDFQNIADRIQSTRSNSTKSGNQPFLKPYNFPNVTNYGTTGEVNKVGNTETYILNLNVYDPISRAMVPITYPLGGKATDKAGIVLLMNSLKDQDIYQTITKGSKAPTQADLKTLEEAAKQPKF